MSDSTVCDPSPNVNPDMAVICRERRAQKIAAELRRLASMPIDELRAMPGTAVNYIR